MRRALLVLVIVAAIVWLVVTVTRAEAQGSGDVYIYGHVEPRAGFVLVRIAQPGGVVIEKLTDGRGEWGAGVRWRAGTYVLTCEGATAGYEFGIPQGETQSGPWVFTLAGAATAFPTKTQSPAIPTQSATNTPRPTIAIPTPTITQSPLPQPMVTPLVMRLQSDGENYVGEFMVELWVDEEGEIEVVNISGAVWRRDR